ncbi:DNA starvation/stationary phase protection protein [Flavobacterium sp.]|uniref:Dps family protein n=1 Tax=Flavobacterium sp. TaxID=239 RepID=UPI002B4B4D88|nr:DNA starvation/stationary phase protection protein [Flavobacterium sp.]HLP64455.1 DNA starvation/stationary phase protection protein [Flavobacterium sp.]
MKNRNPNIGISEKNLEIVATKLNVLLADEYVLYTKTRNAHWNLVGEDFYAVHKFFELQFELLDELIDSIAERVRSLGHFSVATLKNFLSLTQLTEASNQKNDSQGFITALLGDHEMIIIYLREIITKIADENHDVGTSDFLTSVLETHEKMAWLLRSHLTK